METLLDIANNNRLKERQENVRLIIDKYFPNRLDSDHNYLANHELYLVVGLKKERIYHAKKLEELAVLRNKKQLYVGYSDCNYVGGFVRRNRAFARLFFDSRLRGFSPCFYQSNV